MNKKGMGYISMVVVLLVLTVGFAVSSNVDFDVDKFKSSLNWSHQEFEMAESSDLGNALESFVNGLGEAGFHILKWAAQWSSENPEIPFKLLIYLFVLSITAPILLVLFKFTVIIVIMIKEFFQNRKSKKDLRGFKMIKRLKKEEIE